MGIIMRDHSQMFLHTREMHDFFNTKYSHKYKFYPSNFMFFIDYQLKLEILD